MAPNADFDVRHEQDGHETVLCLRGELDIATAPALRERFQELAGRRVTVDLSELTFLDSSGLALLLAKHNDGGLIVRGIQPMQMKVLEITGLAEVLKIDIESPKP